MHQVVANLLANARTHTPAGTSITLSVSREGDEAVLRVHDDGPGIDPGVRDELFARFARGDSSRARQTGGTGLGLAIAKAIVEGTAVHITVASEPGDTTFTVRIPISPAPLRPDGAGRLGGVNRAPERGGSGALLTSGPTQHPGASPGSVAGEGVCRERAGLLQSGCQVGDQARGAGDERMASAEIGHVPLEFVGTESRTLRPGPVRGKVCRLIAGEHDDPRSRGRQLVTEGQLGAVGCDVDEHDVALLPRQLQLAQL